MTYFPRRVDDFVAGRPPEAGAWPAPLTGSIGTMSMIVLLSMTMSTGPSGGIARFVPGAPRPLRIVAFWMTSRS